MWPDATETTTDFSSSACDVTFAICFKIVRDVCSKRQHSDLIGLVSAVRDSFEVGQVSLIVNLRR